jgi:hypothetical protein
MEWQLFQHAIFRWKGSKVGCLDPSVEAPGKSAAVNFLQLHDLRRPLRVSTVRLIVGAKLGEATAETLKPSYSPLVMPVGSNPIKTSSMTQPSPHSEEWNVVSRITSVGPTEAEAATDAAKTEEEEVLHALRNVDNHFTCDNFSAWSRITKWLG